MKQAIIQVSDANALAVISHHLPALGIALGACTPGPDFDSYVVTGAALPDECEADHTLIVGINVRMVPIDDRRAEPRVIGMRLIPPEPAPEEDSIS